MVAPAVVGTPVTVTGSSGFGRPRTSCPPHSAHCWGLPPATTVPPPLTRASSHTGENCATTHPTSAVALIVQVGGAPVALHSGRLQPRKSDWTTGETGLPPASSTGRGMALNVSAVPVGTE